MSYSYSDIESTQLRELTREYVFCPKCGTQNNFSSAPSTQTSFFCHRSSTKISVYWESFRKGKMQIGSCELCGQLTFVSLKYCVSCGEIKEKAAQMRSEKITEQITTKRSRFISGKAKISFIAGLVSLSVGVLLVLFAYISAWSSSSIIVDVMTYAGFILLGLSVYLILIVPLIVFIIEAKRETY